MDITELSKFLLTSFPPMTLPKNPLEEDTDIIEEDTADLPTEKPWWNETAIYSRDGSVHVRGKNKPVHKTPQKPLVLNTVPVGDPDAA